VKKNSGKWRSIPLMSSPKKKSQSSFFLISFIPAVAYWYLEENYSLQIALMGGLLLGALELIVEKIFTGHLHKMSKINFFLILFLGGISLIGDSGVWFKLQPFFTGQAIGGYLLYKRWKKESLFVEMMEQMNNNTQLNPQDIHKLELHFGLLFIFYGFFMAYLAIFAETSVWTFWKTAGFYITSLIFVLVEMIFIVRRNRIK
jgi:intracellular septation protein